MTVVEVLTGEIYLVEVLPVEDTDYNSLSKTRYFFNWKEERTEEVYKLVMKGQNDILGHSCPKRFNFPNIGIDNQLVIA
ncbi:MAG: hypothetical protein K9I85_15540 [Saprospiraceae bacterium]|nr:hypothetical protein [Saprospiraceae bacterium]